MPRIAAVCLLVVGTALLLYSASGTRRITKVVDAYPMLSPDGSRIVFQSNRTGNFELYTAKPDGSDLVQLTKTPYDEGTPIWSPNGTLLTYGAEIDGNADVFVMNADGTGVRRLTDHPGDDSHPHWSPDGSRIVFNSARTTPDLKVLWARQWHEVFSVRLDGSDLRQLTNCKILCTYPVMSPDGQMIAYRKLTNDPGFSWELTSIPRNSEVFVANVDGSKDINISRSAGFDGWPMWSPDGKWVLFSSNRNGPALIGQLFIARPDGTDLRQLTFGTESLVQPSWSADGKQIYAAQYSTDEETASVVVLDASKVLEP